jgi:hypothetical protein
MQTAAAVTMVRDDPVFLAIWLRHYGGLLGRRNLYVVNHGGGAEVARLAEGANVIAIPGEPHRNFDAKRWRLLNGLVAGLRSYYRHVIVGDVDEIVVTDPETGSDLAGLLAATPDRRVLTPLGLEVIHRIECEPDPIDAAVIGPRRHVRPAPHYSKPCIVSTGTKISRGGHFTRHDRLETPEGLYLLHLKFCDFDTYAATMDRRNGVAARTGLAAAQAGIGRHWFAAARGEDRALFQGFARLPLQSGFDLAALRDDMHRTWRQRGSTGYWECARPELAVQYRLPDRFVGLV